jgi:peptidoglycan hydrolase-like protein with peptidoglycan-binding domain
MKKVIKLTESDLERIVKKILQEQSILSEIESDEQDFDESQGDANTQISNFNQSASVDQKQNMMAIQRKLKSLGYNLGNFGPNGDGIDGNYGKRTLAAIKNFQSRNNIKSTGWVGSVTAPLLGVNPMVGVKFMGSGRRKKNNQIDKEKELPKKGIGKGLTPIEPTKSKIKKIGKVNPDSGKTVEKLQQKGFHVNTKGKFEPNKGYFVFSCKESGCAQFTNNMLDTSLGDAWQAYTKFNAEVNVSPQIVNQMTNLFNKMNQSGQIPALDKVTPFDGEAKAIVQQLIPNQSKFQNLPLGTVVGLYYPGSKNYDLAFFQSAIGKSRDEQGKLHDVISKPYFCKNPKNCSSTTWTENDLKKNVKFYPGNTLSSGKAFTPNTHLGFIGYVDKNGTPYVVHNVHNQVFAYPVNDLSPDGLSIIWAGKQIDSGPVAWLKKNNPFA